MTRKEYLDAMGLRCSLHNLDEEVDDDFKSFVRGLISDFCDICHDDNVEEESDD